MRRLRPARRGPASAACSGWRCAATASGCQRVDRHPHADDGLRAERHQAGLPGGGAAAGPGEPAEDARRNDVGRTHVRRQRNRPGRDDGQRADAHADRRHVDPVHSHRDSAYPRRGGKRRSGIGAVVGGRPVCPYVCGADPGRRGQRDTGRHDDAWRWPRPASRSSTPRPCASASPGWRWSSARSPRSPLSCGARRVPRPAPRWRCWRWPHWCAESATSSTIPAAR